MHAFHAHVVLLLRVSMHGAKKRECPTPLGLGRKRETLAARALRAFLSQHAPSLRPIDRAMRDRPDAWCLRLRALHACRVIVTIPMSGQLMP